MLCCYNDQIQSQMLSSNEKSPVQIGTIAARLDQVAREVLIFPLPFSKVLQVSFRSSPPFPTILCHFSSKTVQCPSIYHVLRDCVARSNLRLF